MIKFINLAEGYVGDPIYINPDHIISVFPQSTEHGSLKTLIYGGTNGTVWVVEEGVEEVVKKIEEYKSRM